MTWLGAFVEAAHGTLSPGFREQLYCRGVTDAQVELFQLGCLPRAELPRGVDVSPRFRAWWGNHGAKFRNALVFPLTNALGAVQGLQFRDVDEKLRGYMDYFETKEEPAFFGMVQAMPSVWATEEVWLVEGAFDLFPLQRHRPNILSTMHAGVSKQLARLLRRVARTLLLAYDMDSTGLSVSYELSRELKDSFEVVIVRFPRVRLAKGGLAKDPNELWRAWGDVALGAFLKKVRVAEFST